MAMQEIEQLNDLAQSAAMDTGANFAIHTMANCDPVFYATMGPYLARRAIARELGGPLWDDNGKTWFVAIDATEQVIGFASLQRKSDHVWLDDAWVTESWRNRGVYRALIERRLELCPPETPVRLLAMPSSMSAFAHRGFHVRRSRGQYTEMELPGVASNASPGKGA